MRLWDEFLCCEAQKLTGATFYPTNKCDNLNCYMMLCDTSIAFIPSLSLFRNANKTWLLRDQLHHTQMQNRHNENF